MVLQFTLPLGDEKAVKDIVFTILSKEYPLRIIDLMNYSRKRYGRMVTFQAVRKAVLELVKQDILVQQETRFSINKDWVVKAKSFVDGLYEGLNEEKTSKDVDSIGSEISVFTFASLNAMMKFWQELIHQWYLNFQKGDENINCYQGAHIWEGLLHLEKEAQIMGQLKKKGIISYALCTSNSPLDKNMKSFYDRLGVKTTLDASTSTFDKSYYVATYGDLVVQSQYPQEIVAALEKFFKKNKSLKDLDLVELSDIVNKKVKVKLTVIKDRGMAKQINKSILSEM